MPVLLGGLAALVFLLGIGAVLANAALSQTYSAQAAITDYFHAQSHRNIDGMLSNATFLKGEGAYDVYFGRAALQGMMALPENSDVTNFKILTTRRVDASTVSMTVSMSWDKQPRLEEFNVVKDTTQSHWLFYDAWHVQIPSATLYVKLPDQPGSVEVDGQMTPSGASPAQIQVISGYHRVTMLSNGLWDGKSQVVDAVNTSGSASIDGTISQSAMGLASREVMSDFNSCDASKYDGCFNHTYSAPDSNFIYYFSLPGYGNINYTTYRDQLRGDPTAAMTLTVGADTIAVSGSCAETVMVDGSRRYNVKGDFGGTLSWDGSGFSSSDVNWDCEKAKG